VLVARRFVFFDFNLKAEALILAALGLRWPCVRGNEKWRKRFFVYQISDSLTQAGPCACFQTTWKIRSAIATFGWVKPITPPATLII
jgi:hypothetical protein